MVVVCHSTTADDCYTVVVMGGTLWNDTDDGGGGGMIVDRYLAERSRGKLMDLTALKEVSPAKRWMRQ